VDALIQACEEKFWIVQDYYELKESLLGLESLTDYDRYAPVEFEGAPFPMCDWESASELVVDSYANFSPILGDIVQRFFSDSWIDAGIRPGKRGGAFCASTVPSIHPYILMNYTGKLRDVMTLAHELGHGVHQYLSRSQGILQGSTPLTLAETASVFGEMLVFERLTREQDNKKVALSLLCHKLEDSFATVFRQIALTRFEEKVHQRRTQGELSTEDLDKIWLEANRAMLGDSVQLTDGYKRWWSYIGHFVHVPFYCYAYSFGELLVLALWRRYQEEGPTFVPRYLDLLKAGGSDTPERLVAQMGLNIRDAGFWDSGLGVLEDLLGQARGLAADLD